MASPLTLRHRAAIGGHVVDAATGAPIAGALVMIATPAQSAFTREDGFYSFIDLPDGSYALSASAPALGTRYGNAAAVTVTVASDASGAPQLDPRAELTLAPTRLAGIVRRADTSAPIPYAQLRLRASQLGVVGDVNGRYEFSPVEAGTQLVQVSATGYATSTSSVSLSVGQQSPADFALTPL